MTLDQAIIANDALPQAERKSNVQLADEFGTSETSVRRHRRALKRNAAKVDTDDFFVDVPNEVITSRGRTVRLPDGSFEKVTYSPTAAAIVDMQSSSYDDIAAVFDNPDRVFHNTEPELASGTYVITVADLQVGKVDALGGTPELIKRVLHVYDLIENHLADNQYKQIIIADAGDMLEGFNNTTQQAQTNDISLTDQLRTAQRLVCEAVKRFSQYAPNVIYAAVSSNHCAVRTGTGSKNRSNAPGDDFGLLVQENIRQIIEDRPEYAHVKFVHPEVWEEACTVDCLDGSALGITHGHLAGKQEKVGEWFAHQAFGHRSGLERADVLLHGHFHNFRVGLTGNNKFVVGAPTMDNGSSWFSNTSGESSEPAVLTFCVEGHRAKDWKLWYADDNSDRRRG